MNNEVTIFMQENLLNPVKEGIFLSF